MTPPTPERLARVALHSDWMIRANPLHDEVQAAATGGLLRIGTRHAPNLLWPDEGPFCQHCYRTPWPCPDFRDVAAAVGVEVEG